MKLFKTFSEREVKKIGSVCDLVLKLDPDMAKLTDADLRAKTEEFRMRYNKGESLDSMLVEAFAVVREASWRVFRMKHYPVQVIGGIVLHRGNIAEMRTGEGKTLVSTLPAYLNAISGKGVHVVTVNDYLAKRDSEWMGKIYRFLGLSVGLVVSGMSDSERKKAYAADITYCTNTELGFDYLRDNMVTSIDRKVQRGFNYAIVDEIDSILIDEARTPLIISGFSERIDDDYRKAQEFFKTLNGITIVEVENDVQTKLDTLLDSMEDPYQKYKDYDYVAEEKKHSAVLTDKGILKMEEFYGIEDPLDSRASEINFFVSVALKANTLYKKDVDYVIKKGEIIIVDLGTGRLMPGRRFSNGIHQGIEAKENVEIKAETTTLATITYQNFFRKYQKLSGMTGTAITEKEEFEAIYNLPIIEIPTNKPIQRVDLPDRVYATRKGKLNAIVDQIREIHASGQPILIGTASVEKSEELHKLLVKAKLPHSILNAKFHDREAEIIAQAGRLGSITISTNMAGRGTDIILGGNAEYMALKYFRDEGMDPDLIAEMTEYSETDNEAILTARKLFQEKIAEIKKTLEEETEKVKAVGGLFVLGTERHESRRIDNQLRGRSGRQGDVGTSVFFLSLEDDLMRLFGTDRVAAIMQNNLPENTPIDAKIISNAIQRAQQNIEASHFAQRKRTLEYDLVNAIVRDGVYEQRDKILENTDFTGIYKSTCEKYVKWLFEFSMASKHISLNDYNRIREKIKKEFLGTIDIAEYTEEDLSTISLEAVRTSVWNELYASIIEVVHSLAPENATEDQIRSSLNTQRYILLKNTDMYWKEQIELMDEIKSSVYLQALGHGNPLLAYKEEVYQSFIEMQKNICEGIIKNMMHILIAKRKAEAASVWEQ